MQFIINTITHWEEPPRARHQVAEALSKNHFVVFIAANKPGLFKMKTLLVHENLKVLTPYFPISNKLRYRLPIINELYQYWLFALLRRSYKDFKVINFDFTATKIFSYFSNVIYYCNDNFSQISKRTNPYFIAKYHRYCETKIARNSKFCIAVSSMLRENLLKFNSDSYEIPIGSPDVNDYDILIQNTPSKETPVKVGLVGFISTQNISIRVLNLLLDTGNIDLELIGPIEDKFLDQINNRDRLTVTGPLVGKRLYEEINKFDVTIAPYCERLSKNPQSGVGTGNKLYHYLAVGKPVVISYMEGLTKIHFPKGFLYIANNEDEFPGLVIKAFMENNPILIKQRVDYARNNSWGKRMEVLIAYYNHKE